MLSGKRQAWILRDFALNPKIYDFSWFWSAKPTNQGFFLGNCPKIKSVDRNNGSQLALLFYERHLWAGLLGWPD